MTCARALAVPGALSPKIAQATALAATTRRARAVMVRPTPPAASSRSGGARLGLVGRVLCGGCSVGQLHVREHLAEVANDLFGDSAVEHRKERLQRLDGQPRLVEVTVLATEAVVAERRDRVDGLDEEIGNLEAAQLGLELLDELLLVLARLLRRLLLSHGRALRVGRGRRRSPPSSRRRGTGPTGARPSWRPAPRGTARRRARLPSARPTPPGARGGRGRHG